MNRFCWFARNLWRRKACRFLLAAACAAVVGIAAGRAALSTVVRSVAIVEGNSMEPTFEPGAHLYTSPISISSPLLRGEVVLLDDGNKEQALKRIVGLPGETVHLWRGHVFINRHLLREPYLPKHTYTFPNQRSGGCTFKLGKDQFLVLGDNRLYSHDSRAYGPVDRPQIRSRIELPDNDLHPYFAPVWLSVGKTNSTPS